MFCEYVEKVFFYKVKVFLNFKVECYIKSVFYGLLICYFCLKKDVCFYYFYMNISFKFSFMRNWKICFGCK